MPQRSTRVIHQSRGAGAVARTVHDVLEEVVSVASWGANGDGVTVDTVSFQLAIDKLPASGGRIRVPPGDYSTVVPSSLTVADTKPVVWLADGATLPADMPGTVVKAWQGDITAAGESTRPGRSAFYTDVGDDVVPDNWRDRIYHVNGTLPHAAGLVGDDRSLIAYSFHLSTDQDDSSNGNIRGMQGVVTGNDGQANVRAIRVVAEGINTHTGDLTGLMATVHHPDETDGVAGSIGVSVAIIGEVGAKCTAGFEARSHAAIQRPAFGYRVATGASALLPETACYNAHGGGNGALFRGVRSDTSSDVTFSVDNGARMMARSYYSGRREIADDTVIVIAEPSEVQGTGFFRFWSVTSAGVFAEGYYRVSAASFTQIFSGSASITFTTGVLTGTTGVDGQLTVSVHTDGNIYVENRLGGTPTIAWAFISTAAETGTLD